MPQLALDLFARVAVSRQYQDLLGVGVGRGKFGSDRAEGILQLLFARHRAIQPWQAHVRRVVRIFAGVIVYAVITPGTVSQGGLSPRQVLPVELPTAPASATLISGSILDGSHEILLQFVGCHLRPTTALEHVDKGCIDAILISSDTGDVARRNYVLVHAIALLG